GTTYQMLLATGFLGALCVTALLPAWARQPPALSSGAGRGDGDKPGQTDPAKEIEKLREEIRQLKVQMNELRIQNKTMENHLLFARGVEILDEDYAQARSRFRTKLVRKGPAPQGWTPTKPPEGVSEVEYVSGELRLKAWVNRPTDQARKHPAVLYLHGGFSFDLGDWEQTKPYRDAGFVVLIPILRAENGQPGAWSYFYDEVDDVLAAGEYLSKQPYVDADRL